NTSIDVTLDAYYYYNLKLLTRINIGKTTTSDIYKNNNGFPVAIKTVNIAINTDSRIMVTVQCDNQKSLSELEEIDARYPDEDSDEFVSIKTLIPKERKLNLETGTYGGGVTIDWPTTPADKIGDLVS
ncbi:MAG: hypothetical protein M0R03_16925, partial [Novosphingobium sp.]|nr:hypothetical protein [Novosphingobium sp.]